MAICATGTELRMPPEMSTYTAPSKLAAMAMHQAARLAWPFRHRKNGIMTTEIL
jgi:hypothetical protein